MGKKQSIYDAIIERIFAAHYKSGATEFTVTRAELEQAAAHLKVDPKNLGDNIYSYRFRKAMPDKIRKTAPEGKAWVIHLAGRGVYKFSLEAEPHILPNDLMTIIKVPDATPGLIDLYALSDEQALLAKVRYNRLIDLFLGITCYSLQSHLRTTAPDIGQVETDELYVGLNQRGAHFVIPVQAKGGTDKLSIVQIKQDYAVCSDKFPGLICHPVAAQFMKDNVIALFGFESSDEGLTLASERHYCLVAPDSMTRDEWEDYRTSRAAENSKPSNTS